MNQQTMEPPTSSQAPDWAAIRQALAAPFPPEQINWRVQGKANSQGKAQVLAYLSAREVQERLDAALGPENWSFDWQPVAVEGGELRVAKGTLTIHGVSKSDVGDASTFEGNKGTVSDCFKRAAVQWGIGRHLYDLPSPWVTVEGSRIPEATLQQLQAGLRRRMGPAS